MTQNRDSEKDFIPQRREGVKTQSKEERKQELLYHEDTKSAKKKRRNGGHGPPYREEYEKRGQCVRAYRCFAVSKMVRGTHPAGDRQENSRAIYD